MISSPPFVLRQSTSAKVCAPAFTSAETGLCMGKHCTKRTQGTQAKSKRLTFN